MWLKSARFMDWRSRLACIVLLSLGGISGCKPKIGDECSVSTDCSSTGDRLCDTTQVGGYCTIFNCEPGTCPEEAVCVAFNTSKSLVCDDPQENDRLQRTFCMRNCSEGDDCRGGYDCVDMNDPSNPWGAEVFEYPPVNGAVCIARYSGPEVPENPNTEVCTGTDAGFDATPWVPDGGQVIEDAGDAGDDDASDSSTTTDAGVDASVDADVDADVDGGTDAGADT
jgi:hypothetical protein